MDELIRNYVFILMLTSVDGERGPSTSSCAPPARARGAEADRKPSARHGLSLSLSFSWCGSAICDTLGDTQGVHGAVTARANPAFRRQLARINPVPRLPHQAEAVPSPPPLHHRSPSLREEHR